MLTLRRKVRLILSLRLIVEMKVMRARIVACSELSELMRLRMRRDPQARVLIVNEVYTVGEQPEGPSARANRRCAKRGYCRELTSRGL